VLCSPRREPSFPELRRLKELEAENARLKRTYDDLSLTHHARQDIVAKKDPEPATMT
jgi:hypothetical protein